MEQKKIDRINELSRISRERELSDEEKTERAKLREEYIASFRGNLVSQLENTYYIDKNGHKQKVTRKNAEDNKNN